MKNIKCGSNDDDLDPARLYLTARDRLTCCWIMKLVAGALGVVFKLSYMSSAIQLDEEYLIFASFFFFLSHLLMRRTSARPSHDRGSFEQGELPMSAAGRAASSEDGRKKMQRKKRDEQSRKGRAINSIETRASGSAPGFLKISVAHSFFLFLFLEIFFFSSSFYRPV